uniref:glucose-1-phosphate thymidylyltransferase n=2 Tax=viral metagenome TaxID=1070528 RepID=A0A6M3K0L7_9ZZZZ
MLAGGHGTRLGSLTKVVNKHLLPAFRQPLIYYPIVALRDAGITDIVISLGEHEPGRFFELLGNGEELGVNLSWHYHGEARGIAYAINSARRKLGDEPFACHLGDNIFMDGIEKFVDTFKKNNSHCMIVVQRKPRDELSRYGVPTIDGFNVTKITEKPENPESDYAVLGLYFLNKTFFDIYKELSPSKRGEYEISDALTIIAEEQGLNWMTYDGTWMDCGEPEDLLAASNYIKQMSEKHE